VLGAVALDPAGRQQQRLRWVCLAVCVACH
jgi:hypothetical protein